MSRTALDRHPPKSAPENAIVLVASQAMLAHAAPAASACGLDDVPVLRFSTGLAPIADPKSRTHATMTCLYPRWQAQGRPNIRL
jgi:hypothetical protein